MTTNVGHRRWESLYQLKVLLHHFPTRWMVTGEDGWIAKIPLSSHNTIHSSGSYTSFHITSELDIAVRKYRNGQALSGVKPTTVYRYYTFNIASNKHACMQLACSKAYKCECMQACIAPYQNTQFTIIPTTVLTVYNYD